MAILARRAFLALAALVVPLSRLRLQAQVTPPAVSVDEFIRFSQRILARTAVDRDLATTYLNALLAVPADAGRLVQLVRRPAATPEETTLENTIVEWWYTGAYTLKGEPQLATHTGALMWGALGMPAPGTCAGPFGAWSQPPRARA